MPVSYDFKNLLLVAIFSYLLMLSGCGGGGGEKESAAWVRIDQPEAGYVTGLDVVYAKGNAAMRDGSYPGTVYWSSASGSGVARQSVVCLVACIAAWEADIPLLLGENSITVTMMDGSDQVTVSRYNRVEVGGRVTLDGPEGASVADVPVRLEGEESNVTLTTDESGYYRFYGVTEGTYTVEPMPPEPPQSAACLSFSPANRAFTVPAYDTSMIAGEDFVATQVVPCYYIGGTVTPSTNPSVGLANVVMTLSDQAGNTMTRYTDAYGYYYFWHLEPGTYTVMPSGGTFVPASAEVTIAESNETGTDFSKQY